jgi:teichuronic acid biosynthesis glycosyltransferase TuaG
LIVEPQSVSVIIPTWNRARTLVAAVESALAQTLPPLEVLVCDDGSADNSQALIEAMGNSRVKWIAGARAGRPALPRNRGIALARGEWLAFLDSDDTWLPQKLAKQAEVLQASGHLAACTNAWRVMPGGMRARELLTGASRTLDFDALIHDNKVICSSALVHRSLFVRARGFPENSSLKAIEDYALWLRIACLTTFDYIAEPLVDYTDDAPNSVRAKDRGKWAQRTVIMRDLAQWLAQTRPPYSEVFLPEARRAFYTACLWQAVMPLRRFKFFATYFAKEGAA